MNKLLLIVGILTLNTTFSGINCRQGNANITTGIHLFAEFWGTRTVDNPQEYESLLINACKEALCPPLRTLIQNIWSPPTTYFIVAEDSCLSAQTRPELNYLAIDLFCGHGKQSHNAIAYLEKNLHPQKTRIKEIAQGATSSKYPQASAAVFGQELTIDLKSCNHTIICSEQKIREYIDTLCRLIDMKKFGEPFIEQFALHSEIAAGYSFAQMIETSLISGHLSEQLNNAYINIFSCKEFDSLIAVAFTKEFFGAKTACTCNTIR